MNYLANIHKGEDVPLMGVVCPECPWRKKGSVNRHVPVMPERVMAIAKGNETVMACHMSQKEISAERDQRGIRRCRGIATFRANIGIDSEVFPDPTHVFVNEMEALDSWPRLFHNWERARNDFFLQYPTGHYYDENDQWWVAGKLAPNHDDICIEKCQESVTK